MQNNHKIIDNLFTVPTRQKRGLINGIGTLQNLLFGVMDDNEAVRINKALETLRSSQNNLIHLDNMQTTVITEISRNLNNTKIELIKNSKIYDKTLNKIVDRLDFETKAHLFDEATSIWKFNSEILLDEQNSIINNFQTARMGKLNTKFLNSKTFGEALKHIQLEQTNSIYFPFNLNNLNE